MTATPVPYPVTAPVFREHWFDAAVEVYMQAMNAPANHLPHRRELLRTHLATPSWVGVVAGEPLTGFTYGFDCQPGGWWHDRVEAGLRARYGERGVRAWLADAFCLAELHVRPAWQGRGLGKALVRTLLTDRTQRTVVLSARQDSPGARGFYARLGFTELLVDFAFDTSGVTYAVQGAPVDRVRGHQVRKP